MERLSLRAYARHRGVSPSRIHRLVQAGVLPRDGDGLIPVARADQILDERAQLVMPTVWSANEATKRRLRDRAQQQARAIGRDDADPDPDGMIDPDLADAMLAAQPDLDAEAPRNTPLERALADWELRVALAQNALIGKAEQELRAAAGDQRALSRALGSLYGRLRALIEAERERLADELASLPAPGLRGV